MLQQTESQAAFVAMTKAVSFHGGFAGGDTQPMDTQVYRDYNESMVKSAHTTPQKPAAAMKISPASMGGTYDTTLTDRTPKTCAEGDTGFIDLAQAWQPASPTAQSVSDTDELVPSPETQFHFTSAAKTAMPETPALAGHKRNRSGEVIMSVPSTAAKTPGFSQFFGGGAGPVLSATQMFNQTQAPSSPLPEVPRSDPVMTRPSPNLNMHAGHSSPAATMSSPVAMFNPRPSAISGEPRVNYTSMKESQERRAARLREEAAQRERASYGDIEEDEEDEENSQLRRFEQKKLHRVMSDQALQRSTIFSAPLRPGSRPGSSKKQQTEMIDLVTPATTRKGTRVEFDISDDDIDTEEELDVNENAIEAGAEVHRASLTFEEDEEMADDDVYDELGQTVLRSQANEPDEEETGHDDGASYTGSFVHLEEEEDPTNDSGRNAEELAQKDGSTASAAPLQNVGKDFGATQRSAIADSQPASNPTETHRHAEHGTLLSSVSSIVPGSQYAAPGNQGSTRPGLPELGGALVSNTSYLQVDGDENKLPSSPPMHPRQDAVSQQLPAQLNGQVGTIRTNESIVRESSPLPASTIPEDTEEASVVRRNMLAQFQKPIEANIDARSEQEIPESELADHEIDNQHSRTAASAPVHKDSNSVPLFSTAQTHLSASGPSPSKRTPVALLTSQHSRLASESPRKKAGVRRFSSIAADPTPPEASGEASLDVDAIMDGVVTTEDQEFIDTVSSPPRGAPPKRREITTSRRASASPERRAATSSPKQKLRNTRAQVQQDETEQAPPAKRRRLEIGSKVAFTDSPALQSSPSKANELPAATPPRRKAPAPTPESVKLREEAGAEAAAKLLSARPPKEMESSRSASEIDNATVVDGEDIGRPLKRGKKTSRESNSNTDTKGSVITKKSGMKGRKGIAAQRQLANPSMPRLSLLGIDDFSDHTKGENASYPARIFALFKGTLNAYYPATCLSSSADGGSHRVRFDDGTITTLENHHVAMLELRAGDHIKVDLPGMRGKTWIISGFKVALSTGEVEFAQVDNRGHHIVVLQPKGSRDSLQVQGDEAVIDGGTVKVPVATVYLTHNLWKHFAGRIYGRSSETDTSNPRTQTPTTGVRTPNLTTPASRSRRSATQPGKSSNLSKASYAREDSVASSASWTTSGLFTGMAFAISYGSNETGKANVTRLIQRNGGRVLDNGFEELFMLPALDEDAITSPSKCSPSKDKPFINTDLTELRLKPTYKNMGFVALIADKHSRRAKYMQALALGLPTLSGRWITDSLDASRNVALSSPAPQALTWTKYLLPAGESAYLGGAVRSRTLRASEPAATSLADTIDGREKLLNGEGVIIVAEKKTKGTWERRRAYAFLTLALGAGEVKRVADLTEARSLLDADEGKWKWVYVDGALEDSEKALLGQRTVGNNKKRKRGEDDGCISKTLTGMESVRLVGDEFVVQSLILGALID